VTWRVANSLNVLLDQLNTLYPNRSKVSDGSIGDAEHAGRDSDHNPWYGPGIVTARDFTDDPDGGLDCHKLAGWLVKSGDKRIKYIIWNRRIWQGSWMPYYGSNPHTKHLHLSVVASPLCDNTAAWNLGEAKDMLKDERNWLADLHMVVVSGARRDKQLNNDLGYIKDQAVLAANNARAEAAHARAEIGDLKATIAQAVGEAVASYLQAHPPVAAEVDYARLAKAVREELAEGLREL